MYTLKYKRNFFWNTYKNVKGHTFIQDMDRMDIFFEDKIISIPKWSQCTLLLGHDFILQQKKDINKEAGRE